MVRLSFKFTSEKTESFSRLHFRVLKKVAMGGGMRCFQMEVGLVEVAAPKADSEGSAV